MLVTAKMKKNEWKRAKKSLSKGVPNGMSKSETANERRKKRNCEKTMGEKCGKQL